MAHNDSRKALHDPNPPPRQLDPQPPVTLDVTAMAARAAAALSRQPRDEWPMLERIYIERLLDHLEGKHEPVEIDATAVRFVEALHELLGRP